MATINNSELSKELVDGAKIEQSYDKVPNQLAEKVVPVMEVNPKNLRICNIVERIGSSGVIYTTPTDKDFYLIGSSIAMTSKTAGLNTCTITATIPNKGVQTINSCMVECDVTMTTGQDHNTIMLPIPMKMKRGTAITGANTGTPSGRNWIIYGFTVEVE